VRPFERALEYYSPNLKKSDITQFLDRLRQFRSGDSRLADVRKIVQIWAVRYDKQYVRQHAIFRPYPGPLADA
jgi:uncharacterized protein YbgA (DUF1722 family)